MYTNIEIGLTRLQRRLLRCAMTIKVLATTALPYYANYFVVQIASSCLLARTGLNVRNDELRYLQENYSNK